MAESTSVVWLFCVRWFDTIQEHTLGPKFLDSLHSAFFVVCLRVWPSLKFRAEHFRNYYIVYQTDQDCCLHAHYEQKIHKAVFFWLFSLLYMMISQNLQLVFVFVFSIQILLYLSCDCHDVSHFSNDLCCVYFDFCIWQSNNKNVFKSTPNNKYLKGSDNFKKQKVDIKQSNLYNIICEWRYTNWMFRIFVSK